MTLSNPPRLADGIGIARFDDWVIVLDIPGDRYTRLVGETAQMLEAIHNGEPIDPDDPAVAALKANAFITWQAPCVTPWFSPSELHAPEASALEGGDPEHRIGLRDLGVVIDCAASRWALRRRSLPHILQDLPLERQRRSDGDVVALARAFDRGRRLAPFTPRCLPDSLAFVRHARRQGHPVNIVFGVKCFPFEAHCWAQSGGMVLTDPLERVRRFSPMLAI
jgi:hypothetical protein